jgi:hypothetical protein
MGASDTPERSADAVRLVPDGCDYVLRGVATGDAGTEVIAIRAIAPGGTAVLAHISRDARGLTVDATTGADAAVLTLHNVPVSASQVFPA